MIFNILHGIRFHYIFAQVALELSVRLSELLMQLQHLLSNLGILPKVMFTFPCALPRGAWLYSALYKHWTLKSTLKCCGIWTSENRKRRKNCYSVGSDVNRWKLFLTFKLPWGQITPFQPTVVFCKRESCGDAVVLWWWQHRGSSELLISSLKLLGFYEADKIWGYTLNFLKR